MSLTLSTASCNSMFDDAPLNQITEETTWTNSMLLDEYVNTWYRNMSNGFDVYVFTMSGFGSMSRFYLPWFGDQILCGRIDWANGGIADIQRGNLSAVTNWAQQQWSNYYTQIQYINSFFENEGRITDAAQRPAILKEYTDSAHLLRPNHWYTVRIEVTADGRNRYFLDNELLVDYRDASPLLHGWFAFRTTWSHTRLTAFTIKQL